MAIFDREAAVGGGGIFLSVLCAFSLLWSLMNLSVKIMHHSKLGEEKKCAEEKKQVKGKIAKEKKQVKGNIANMQMVSLSLSAQLTCLVLLSTMSTCIGVDSVPFTPVIDAVERSAVCLDGSPAGYHFAAGFGSGASSWLVVLMGGGWCSDIATCQGVRSGGLGSTNSIGPADFTGMLSSSQDINPDFHDWNKVYVVYCDQASFLGDTEITDQGPHLDFRGSKIFNAVVEDLLDKGLGLGANAILAGRSAGGLSAILHCDSFRAAIPDVGRVKCLSDSGAFIRAKNIVGAEYREQLFASIITLHNLSSFLPRPCTKMMGPNLCFFGEYLIGDVETPLFILNSAFDYYEAENNLVPKTSPGYGRWKVCLKNLTDCPAQLQLIKDFGDTYFQTIVGIPPHPSRGLFVHACFNHVVAFYDKYWAPNSTVKLGNMTISEAFATWYFDRSPVSLISSSKGPEPC